MKGTDSKEAPLWYTPVVRHSQAAKNPNLLSNLLSILGSEQGVLDRQYRLDRQSLNSISGLE